MAGKKTRDGRMRALRSRLSRELGRSIPAPIWKELVKDKAGHVALALEEDADQDTEPTDAWGNLVAHCETLITGYAANGHWQQAPRTALDTTYELVRLEPDDLERAAVVRDALAKRAYWLPVVARFVNRTIRGRLQADAAHAFVMSPAAAIFSPEWFTEQSVDVCAHDARVLDAGFDDDRAWANIVVRPPEQTVSAEIRGVRADGELSTLFYPKGSGTRSAIRVWPGSVLDELREVSELLARRFAWAPEQAARLVVEAEAPDREPVRAWADRKGSRVGYVQGVIRLEVEPWVSPASVERTFRAVQQMTIGYHRNKHGEVVPKENRPLLLRSLAVFEFVEDHRFRHGHVENWRELARLWNAAVPDHGADWRYEGGEAAKGSPAALDMALDKFKRAYDQAAERLLRPVYHIPGNDPLGDETVPVEYKRRRPPESS